MNNVIPFPESPAQQQVRALARKIQGVMARVPDRVALDFALALGRRPDVAHVHRLLRAVMAYALDDLREAFDVPRPSMTNGNESHGADVVQLRPKA